MCGVGLAVLLEEEEAGDGCFGAVVSRVERLSCT
jgi:hypothetical protein